MHGHVFGDVERESGFSHRRTCRQNDQVAGLEPRCQAVHVVETGAHTGHFFGAVVMQFVDPVDQRDDQRVHALKSLARTRTLFADAKDLGLGFVEDF